MTPGIAVKRKYPSDPLEAGIGFPSGEPVDEARLCIKLSQAEAARCRRLAKAVPFIRMLRS